MVARLAALRARRRFDALALAALAGIAVYLFRFHLLGVGVFMGTSDRLNVPLALRKLQVDGIRRYGYIPAWSEHQFLGFPLVGNTYLPAIYDPLPYVLAWFPVERLTWVYGIFTMLLMIASMYAAYAYVKDASGSALAAFVGGALYVFSSYGIMRIGQIDPLSTTFVQMPLGLLLLRRAQHSRWWLSLLGMTAVTGSMLLWGFAQEVLYIGVLFGVYALTRTLQDRSIRPLLVLGVGGTVGALAALPRLAAFRLEAAQSARGDAFMTTCWCEVFRWLNEGIFGRYASEVRVAGNDYNIHEGFQLYTSTFAALCLLIALSWVRRWSRLGASDVPFHVGWLLLTVAVVVIEPVTYVVYLVFARADLLHSRFSVVGMLSTALLCGMVARALATRAWLPASGRAIVLLCAGAGTAAVAVVLAVNVLAEGPITPWTGLAEHLPAVGPGMRFLPVEVMRVAWAAVVVAAGAVAWGLTRPAGRRGAPEAPGAPRAIRTGVAALGVALMVAQAGLFADLQFSGPQTWSFPVPFARNDDFTAPPSAFQAPGPETRRPLRERLEADQFRSVIIMRDRDFPLFNLATRLEYATHVAAFWDLRVIQGYPGISRRFANYPWPRDTVSPRSLYFSATTKLPWELLALLNVKYAVTLNPALYFNLANGDPLSGPNATVADLEVRVNPNAVMPRQFFAASIRPLPPSRAAARAGALLTGDPRDESLVEGIDRRVEYATDGEIRAQYDGDRVTLEMDPLPVERFLVLNEAYHPGWRAYTDGKEIRVFPTNVAMRGVVVPAGGSRVDMRFTLPAILSVGGADKAD